MSDLNREFEYAPTYPSVLVFPERASDAHMQAVSHAKLFSTVNHTVIKAGCALPIQGTRTGVDMDAPRQ